MQSSNQSNSPIDVRPSRNVLEVLKECFTRLYAHRDEVRTESAIKAVSQQEQP